MSGATTFHLVRHASYDQLGRRLAGRSPGHSLNEDGRAEAAALASAFSGRAIAAVVSSPLERARETAMPIAAAHGLPVAIEPDLNEIDFGDWTGMAFAELHGNPDWQRFNVFRSAVPIPGGESVLAVQARAVAAILRLRAAYPAGEVVAISHGDVVKAILFHFLGMPLDFLRRIEIAPASRSELVLHADDARVRAVNLPAGT
jgi:broad specificity phosphatase PhoE